MSLLRLPILLHSFNMALRVSDVRGIVWPTSPLPPPSALRLKSATLIPRHPPPSPISLAPSQESLNKQSGEVMPCHVRQGNQTTCWHSLSAGMTPVLCEWKRGTLQKQGARARSESISVGMTTELNRHVGVHAIPYHESLWSEEYSLVSLLLVPDDGHVAAASVHLLEAASPGGGHRLMEDLLEAG